MRALWPVSALVGFSVSLGCSGTPDPDHTGGAAGTTAGGKTGGGNAGSGNTGNGGSSGSSGTGGSNTGGAPTGGQSGSGGSATGGSSMGGSPTGGQGGASGGGTSTGGSSGTSGTSGTGGGTGTMPSMKEMLQKLTGELPIDGTKKISKRSTADEKKAARDYMASVFSSIGYEPKTQEYTGGANLYVELPSTTGSTDYVVMGGHYDSVAGTPGADDNASGTVMAIQLAWEAKQISSRSKNLIFAAFDQEESGTGGSRAFVQKVKADNLKVVSSHSIDMVAWDGDGDRAVEVCFAQKTIPELVTLYETSIKEAGLNVPIHTIQNFARSDHANFQSAGINAVLFIEEFSSGDANPQYHAAGDKVSAMNFDYIESNRKILVQVIKNLVK